MVFVSTLDESRGPAIRGPEGVAAVLIAGEIKPSVSQQPAILEKGLRTESMHLQMPLNPRRYSHALESYEASKRMGRCSSFLFVRRIPAASIVVASLPAFGLRGAFVVATALLLGLEEAFKMLDNLG